MAALVVGYRPTKWSAPVSGDTVPKFMPQVQHVSMHVRYCIVTVTTAVPASFWPEVPRRWAMLQAPEQGSQLLPTPIFVCKLCI